METRRGDGAEPTGYPAARRRRDAGTAVVDDDPIWYFLTY